MTPLAPPDAAQSALRARAREVRLAIRAGEFRTQTSGQAPGIVQGNVVILPSDWAGDFLRFCQANPKPCPLLAVSEPGSHALPRLGADIDIRTDLPMYRVFRDGTATEDTADIRDIWRPDLVTFVLGCSFSFEEALIEAGIRLRHIDARTDVAVYRTNIPTAPAGRFSGPLVVSMRPFRPADAIRAIQITSRFPNVHGAPVHLGDPQYIGINDLQTPDWGDAAVPEPGDIPLFWACGVTPQSVVAHAKPPFCITHKPSHMLITDLLNAELAVF